MVAVLIGLILIVTIAIAIMAMVAAPRLRQGDELLTREGKQTIIRASQNAREQSAAAAGNTVQAVSTLRDKVSSAWSPASDFLHQQFDRLETDPAAEPASAPAPVDPVDPVNQADQAVAGSVTPDQPVAPAPLERRAGSGPASHGRDVAPAPPAAGVANVGAPRPIPADSGPIPMAEPAEPAEPADRDGRDRRERGHGAGLREYAADEMEPQSSIYPTTHRRIY